MRGRRALVFVILSGIVAGCPRPPIDSTPPAIEDATAPSSPCAEFASTACTKEERCRPARVRSTYGDRVRCVERQTLACELGLAAPGTGANAETLHACAAAIEAAACDALPEDLGACPAIHGPLPAMALCMHDAQCAVGTCSGRSFYEPNPCFRCVAGGRDGDGCNPLAGCADGFTCVGKACQSISKISEGCAMGGEAACGARGSCAIDHDGQPRCRARAKEGEPCRADESFDEHANLPRCDVDAGLGCVSGTCAKTEWLPPGSKCNLFDDAHRCLAGECDDDTCTPIPKEGSECLGGWTCLPPANCLSGKCALPNASTCAAAK